MVCENDYCLYNKEGKCSMEKISINSVGSCEDCVMVALDGDILNKEKKRQLQEIENR